MRCQCTRELLAVIFCACAVTAVQAAQQTIYVDAAATGANDGSSWPDAYVLLQDALVTAADAVGTVEIKVAQGQYHPDEGLADPESIENATFGLFSGVTLRGGYAGVATADPEARDVRQYPSVLSGSGADPATSARPYRVVTGTSVDATTVLDGFTIAKVCMAYGLKRAALC